MTTIQVANDIYLPSVLANLALTPEKTGTIGLRGRSMRPFLEDGRDRALLKLPTEAPKVGQPVLAEVAPGFFVLHRIIRIEGDAVTLLGDGNLTTEHCHLKDIRAIAVGFLRKGREKPDLITGRKWRVYSAVWTRLRPFRRYLLFALHPHIPARLKRGKQ